MSNAQRVQIQSMANGTVFQPVGDALKPAPGAACQVIQHDSYPPGTAATVFANETGLATLSQPLTADGFGQCPGWVAAGQDLDIVAQFGGATIGPLQLEPMIASEVGANYQTVEVNDVASTPRGALDLEAGSNVTVTAADDPVNNRTKVTIASTASGGGSGVGFGNVVSKTANYTVLSTDSGSVLAFNGSSLTATLPSSVPAQPWMVVVLNENVSNLILSPNGKNLNGSGASLGLAQNQAVIVWSDGTNYEYLLALAAFPADTDYYQTLQVNGSAETQRSILDLVAGSGVTLTPTDDSGNNRTEVTIAASGGGGGSGVGFGSVVAKTANYTILSGDSGTVFTFSGSSLTASLPATAPAEPWQVAILNLNSSPLTVSPNGRTLNGSSSAIMLAQNQSVVVWSDGTNYFDLIADPLGAAATETARAEAAEALLIPLSQKGASGGVASLDSSGDVLTAELPPSVPLTSQVNTFTAAQTINVNGTALLYKDGSGNLVGKAGNIAPSGNVAGGWLAYGSGAPGAGSGFGAWNFGVDTSAATPYRDWFLSKVKADGTISDPDGIYISNGGANPSGIGIGVAQPNDGGNPFRVKILAAGTAGGQASQGGLQIPFNTGQTGDMLAIGSSNDSQQAFRIQSDGTIVARVGTPADSTVTDGVLNALHRHVGHDGVGCLRCWPLPERDGHPVRDIC